MVRKSLWKYITICILAAAVAAALAGTAAAEAVIVNQPKVNLRSGPGTSFPKVGEATGGTRLEVLGAKGEWTKVRLPGGGEGWIYSPLVDREFGPDTFFLVTVAKANLRKGPGVSEALMGSVVKGTSLPALGSRGKWIKVSWSGKTVWISADLGTVRSLDPADLDAGAVPRGAEALRNTVIRNLRSSSSSAVASVKAGTDLRYLDSRDGWVQVGLNGKTGWIEGKNVKVYNQAPFVRSVNYTVAEDEWSIRRYPIGRVKGSFVNLRSGPGTGYKKIGRLPGGRYFEVLESRSGWYRLVSERGETGWISSSLATIVNNPLVRLVAVRAESPQRKQVVVEGGFGQPVVKVLNDGRTLAAWFQNAGAGAAKVDVNTFDLGSLSVNDNGMKMDLVEKANVRITQAAPGRITAVIETSVTGVTVRRDGKRDVVSVSTLGYAEPCIRARQDGQGIDLVVPGAILNGSSSGSGGIVQKARVSGGADGVVVSIDTPAWRRHVARRGDGCFNVEFLEPGLKGKTIVLDPGHGGPDPGAIGPRGLYEKYPNLTIALSLKSMLEKAGAKVAITRSNDSPSSGGSGNGENGYSEDLSARVALAQSSGADLFLSIHNNANNDRSKSGSTTYYAASSVNAVASRALCEALQAELVRALGRADNGVRAAEHYVSRTSPVPAAIAEVVYISNAEEEALLGSDDFCRKAATALYDGLKKFYG